MLRRDALVKELPEDEDEEEEDDLVVDGDEELHLLGQPIQKKHCQARTTLRRTHGTNLHRLLCTRAFVDISSLYVFYSAFYFKKRV
jgi:hypothetical protein